MQVEILFRCLRNSCYARTWTVLRVKLFQIIEHYKRKLLLPYLYSYLDPYLSDFRRKMIEMSVLLILSYSPRIQYEFFSY